MSPKRGRKALRVLLIAAAIMVLLAIIGAIIGEPKAQKESDQTPSTTSDIAQTEATIDKGLGSKDASGDLVSFICGDPDSLGFRYPEVTVMNHSSKTSTYFITIIAQSADESTRYDQTQVLISSLLSGQTTTERGLPFTNEIPPGATCRVTELQRTSG